MFAWAKLAAGFVSFINNLLRSQERARDRQAGADKQVRLDTTKEREAMEKGDEEASKIRTGDHASAAFKRMRERQDRSS